jgi:nitrate/TMAO reductase-like tetraheme cytochrome c subunit
MIKILFRCILATWLVLFASTSWNLLAEPKANRKEKTATESGGAASNDSYMGLTGEELWSNNCLRCHNIRPPTMYNNAQWDVIVHHMRLRSNITGQEQRLIVEFLKSAK